MNALIDKISSLVVQTSDTTFDVDKDHEWVTCDDSIVAGQYTYTNGVFSPISVSVEPTAEQNQAIAIAKLTESDFSVLPDVELTNKADWVAYRAALRQIALTPSSGNIVWPAKPTEQWA